MQNHSTNVGHNANGIRNPNTNVNRNANVNRNTNVHQNVNVNRNVNVNNNVNVPGGYYGGCCYHEDNNWGAFAAGAMVGIATTAAVAAATINAAMFITGPIIKAQHSSIKL